MTISFQSFVNGDFQGYKIVYGTKQSYQMGIMTMGLMAIKSRTETIFQPEIEKYLFGGDVFLYNYVEKNYWWRRD